MEYFDSKVLESFMIPEDSIAIEGFGSKFVNFIKMIFKSIGRFFKIIGNTFVNLIKKMKRMNNGSWETETRRIDALMSLVQEILNGNINKNQVINALAKIEKKFSNDHGWSLFQPERIDKSEWNKKYLNELAELFYHGADSKVFITYMAEVSDYIYGDISSVIKTRIKSKFDIKVFDQFISNCNSFSDSSFNVLRSGAAFSAHPTKTIVEEINKKYDNMSTDFEKVIVAYKNLDNIFSLNTKITNDEYNEITERVEKESIHWNYLSNEFDQVLKSLDNEKSNADNINNEYFAPFQKAIMNANSQISKLTKMITDMSNNILKLQVE